MRKLALFLFWTWKSEFVWKPFLLEFDEFSMELLSFICKLSFVELRLSCCRKLLVSGLRAQSCVAVQSGVKKSINHSALYIAPCMCSTRLVGTSMISTQW